jgi:hypothetical protein
MDELSSQIPKVEWLRVELIKLLGSDCEIQRLVLEIVASREVSLEPLPEPISEPEQEPVSIVAFPATAHERPHDPLRTQLSAQLTLLDAISSDQELNSTWFVQGEDQGRQLARLLASAAQWERLLELWDLLAERCKSQARPAHVSELHILEGCLGIHNLIWRDRQAELCQVDAGVEYDYRLHQRATLRGDVIAAQWLPGLANAGGERQRLPLAATE